VSQPRWLVSSRIRNRRMSRSRASSVRTATCGRGGRTGPRCGAYAWILPPECSTRRGSAVPLAFRNLDITPDAPVSSWPTEGVQAALERGDLEHWRRIVAEVNRDPWGRTARGGADALPPLRYRRRDGCRARAGPAARRRQGAGACRGRGPAGHRPVRAEPLGVRVPHRNLTVSTVDLCDRARDAVRDVDDQDAPGGRSGRM
jgi:hypothetical protein